MRRLHSHHSRLVLTGLILGILTVVPFQKTRAGTPVENAKWLQQAIDDLRGANGSGKEGGRLVVPPGEYDFGDQPMRTYGRLDIQFDHIRNTRIKSTAKFVILLCGEGGNPYVWRSRIAGCTVIGAQGGIGFDSALADSEASHCQFEDMEVYAGIGDAVDLRHPHGQQNYRFNLKRVTAVSDPGRTAFNVPARVTLMEGCEALAYNYVSQAKSPGGVVLSGSSIKVDTCRFEGTWNGPALRVEKQSAIYGSYGSQAKIINTHIESVGGIVFNGAHITADTTEEWLVQPKQPCLLQNGSRLDVAGIIGFTDNGGGTNTQIDKCYKCDNSSAVVKGTSTVVGRVN